jgi:hypothetical protein
MFSYPRDYEQQGVNQFVSKGKRKAYERFWLQVVRNPVKARILFAA